MLSYNLFRKTRTVGATFDNDAIGCFDRIIAEVGMLTCRRIGLPKKASEFICKILKATKHKVRTAHGTSEKSLQGDKNCPLDGTGEGSGASMAIWFAISAVIIDVLKSRHKGIQFYDPTGKTTLTEYVTTTSMILHAD